MNLLLDLFILQLLSEFSSRSLKFSTEKIMSFFTSFSFIWIYCFLAPREASTFTTKQFNFFLSLHPWRVNLTLYHSVSVFNSTAPQKPLETKDSSQMNFIMARFHWTFIHFSLFTVNANKYPETFFFFSFLLLPFASLDDFCFQFLCILKELTVSLHFLYHLKENWKQTKVAVKHFEALENPPKRLTNDWIPLHAFIIYL